MGRLLDQKKTYFLLLGIALLAQCIVTPYMRDNPQTAFNWISLIVFAVLGYSGLVFFQERAGFPAMWDRDVSHSFRFAFPAAWGVVFAAGAILFDYFGSVQLPHIPFPLSLAAYTPVAIMDNLFWRLFVLTSLTCLFSERIFRKSRKERIFQAVMFAEIFLYIIIQINLYRMMAGPLSLYSFIQIVTISGGFVLAACILYRRYGFLAPVTMHLVQYWLYHGVYGSIFSS